MAQVRHGFFQFGAEAAYQKNRPPVMIKNEKFTDRRPGKAQNIIKSSGQCITDASIRKEI